MNMIEKLVLGGVTETGDPQPDALTSAPSSHAIWLHILYTTAHSTFSIDRIV